MCEGCDRGKGTLFIIVHRDVLGGGEGRWGGEAVDLMCNDYFSRHDGCEPSAFQDH